MDNTKKEKVKKILKGVGAISLIAINIFAISPFPQDAISPKCIEQIPHNIDFASNLNCNVFERQLAPFDFTASGSILSGANLIKHNL